MVITIIAAVAENGVIGRAGGLPWNLPEDLRRFKRVTSGHPVIMGRRTFETLPGPLAGRRNIVITRNPAYQADGVIVVGSLDAALADAGRVVDGDDPVFILGGGEIYRLALPIADRLDLTRVLANPEGDAWFPDVRWVDWDLVSRDERGPDDRHAVGFRFETWRRRLPD